MSLLNQYNLLGSIKEANKFEEVVAAIYEWHEDCEHGNNGECEIFDAIKSGKTDEEIIKIAFDVDPDLFDKFNLEDFCAIRKGVYIYWEAFDIARIGNNEMYRVVEQTFMGTFGIDIEVLDMVITAETIEGDGVEWRCVPTEYNLKS